MLSTDSWLTALHRAATPSAVIPNRVTLAPPAGPVLSNAEGVGGDLVFRPATPWLAQTEIPAHNNFRQTRNEGVSGCQSLTTLRSTEPNDRHRGEAAHIGWEPAEGVGVARLPNPAPQHHCPPHSSVL